MVVPELARALSQGACELPRIWLYEWFSSMSTTTRRGGGEGRPRRRQPVATRAPTGSGRAGARNG